MAYMDGFVEKCGIAGVKRFEGSVSEDIYKILISQSNRGQEGAGMVVYDTRHNIYREHRRVGKVREAFYNFDFSSFTGGVGIGHNRYSTVGSSDISLVQPLKGSLVYMGHNGTISPNSIGGESCDVDTRIIIRRLEEGLHKGGWKEAVSSMGKKLDGAYSCVALWEDRLLAFRDPRGFRPLVVGKLKDGFAVASETQGLEILGAHKIWSVRPGEAILIDDDVESYQFADERHAHCAFEWVYFSKPENYFEGASCDEVRFKLGEQLAEMYPVEADIVSPVPDSGRSAASGYSKASGIPFRETLQPNREIARVFITPDEASRLNARAMKYHPLREAIHGKRIILVDDSIVRSTTLKYLVALLKQCGAKEVHLRITFPPVIAPCFMGIAFSTTRELAINKFGSVDGLRKDLGADSIGFMDLERMKTAIGMDDLCTACVTGKYPLKEKIDLKEAEATGLYVHG